VMVPKRNEVNAHLHLVYESPAEWVCRTSKPCKNMS
jgi:hypothetical protein